MTDPDVGMLRILDYLIRAGVPADAAGLAIDRLRRGDTVDAALGPCLEAILSPLDLLLLIRAEQVVIRSEIAVRERQAVRVRRGH